jgi:hypothetical protein
MPINKVTDALVTQLGPKTFVSKSKIEARIGAEGPRFDRSVYDEYTITRNEKKWVVHIGLEIYINADGALFIPPDMPGALDLALKASGCPFGSTKEIEKSYQRAKAEPLKLHKVHGGAEWKSGHPGEELLICKCGSVLDSSVDLSAIE